MAGQEPLKRRVARAALLDGAGRVLLLRDTDPEWGGYWYLPGGHIEEGETSEDAARREVYEETGLVVKTVSLMQRYRARFVYGGRQLDQQEWHFFARVPDGRPVVARDGDNERAAIDAHRWWSIDDLRSTTETIYPEDLSAALQQVAAPEPHK